LDQLLGFALAVTPMMLTPGVSLTLVVQRVVSEGRGAGFRVAAGTACRLLVHGATAVVGLAALISQSATAFSIVKAAGAVYLVAVGVSLLRSPREGRRAPPSLPWRISAAFPEALLVNVLNPRAASVYLTLVPQFVGRRDVLAMTVALVAVHITMQTLWLSLWTILLAGAHQRIRLARFRRPLQRISGAVLIGIGLRTAAAGAR
jgi:threonine/homoserine/homoserine lactone efflux protein